MKEKKELKFNAFFSDSNELEQIIINYLKELIKNSRNEMQKI